MNACVCLVFDPVAQRVEMKVFLTHGSQNITEVKENLKKVVLRHLSAHGQLNTKIKTAAFEIRRQKSFFTTFQ